MSIITVFGAGAFGTALAISLARGGKSVSLVARNPEKASTLQAARENSGRLPGAVFPDALCVTSDAPADSKVCLIAVPTQSLAGFIRQNTSYFSGQKLVACCKGIDLKSGLSPTAVIRQECQHAQTAILSGPSFASDIAAGLPTALTLAAENDKLAQELQHLLSNTSLRLYRTNDVAGVELGGALKNVIAIGAGVTAGAGFGESARAALITRGFAEISRYAQLSEARAETLAGLSGFGDIILTCTSEKSRNYRYGITLGRGEIVAKNETIEGVSTAKAIAILARSRGIEMPVAQAVSALLDGSIEISQAVEMLLSRPLTKE